jgi:hypothetical protein
MENELKNLDLSFDQIVDANFKSDEELIGGKYPRRKRIPKIFGHGEHFQRKYKNGLLSGIQYYDRTNMYQILEEMAVKASKKKQEGKSKKKKKIEKEEFIYINNIKAKLLERTEDKVKYWLFFQPKQVKELKENLADKLEIHPICQEQRALRLKIKKSKKKKIKEYILGINNSASLKHKWEYQIENLLNTELKVYIELSNSN